MELNHTRTMGKSISYIKEVKWREDTIIRINEADTNVDTKRFNESRNISTPPKALVDVKPESYRPQILTIGPLYEMFSENSPPDHCKALCVSRFMRRHGISDVHQLMQRLFDDPSNLHLDYSGLSRYSCEFLQLLLTVDTIFLSEFLLFLSTNWNSILDEHYYFDTLCNNDITYNQVLRDLFVMGNQIPMSHLKKLIEVFPSKPKLEKDKLQDALVDVVKEVDPFFISHSVHEKFTTPKLHDCDHLLDCLYVWVLRDRLQKKKKKREAINPCRFQQVWNIFLTNDAAPKTNEATHKKTKLRERLPSASQLCKAGIWFRAIEGAISVMHYDKRSLRFDLPRLVVYDKTEDVLRNLLAHEQTSKYGYEFTKYAVIMDSLIDTAEDVAILTNAEVIENHLGSDEKLLNMWNDMCITVSDRRCERWDGMIKAVLHHYHCPWRAMYVEFREKYFSRPWLTISLIVAFLLLLFSLVQTSYTVAGYYQSKH